MASRTAKPRYTKQIVLLVSEDVAAVVNVAAREQGLSKAEVARAFLHAGMNAAGYTPQTIDSPQPRPAGGSRHSRQR